MWERGSAGMRNAANARNAGIRNAKKQKGRKWSWGPSRPIVTIKSAHRDHQIVFTREIVQSSNRPIVESSNRQIVKSSNRQMGWYDAPMSLDERAFFTDRQETRQGKYTCPKCRRTNDYPIRWVRRAKKDRLPPGADDGDRARFAKLRDYLLRLDEDVVCKACGKKFEIPSQHSAALRGPACRPAQRRGTGGGDQAGIGRNGTGA